VYSTCLFCHRPLGANDLIERFPVGRRLAFDAAKGRLWVICPSCQRWNLTPLEERWEAVEDLERRVRATRFRVSTDNIGLARLAGGLDAVRIGRPLRPEMAGWRYGRVIRRRYWRQTALAVFGFRDPRPDGYVKMLRAIGRRFGEASDVIVRDADGHLVRLTPADLAAAQLLPAETVTGWALHLIGSSTVVLTGEPAMRAASLMLARLNWRGAPSQSVRDAVRYLDAAGDPNTLIARIARTADANGMEFPIEMPDDVRLAWEMATHDASEREALGGELASLEMAWRDAEAIAAIADNLLLPDTVGTTLDRLRDDNRA
jgi:hypothetical protein